MTTVVGILCHESEPGVTATVRSLLADAPDARIIVCVNGPNPRHSVADRALAPLIGTVEIAYLDVASKPAAWNHIRSQPAEVLVFADADITVATGSIAALEAALAEPRYALAAAGQRHPPPTRLVERIASVPHRLEWGGVLGTLYAARPDALPETMPDEILLDDAWLWATVGGDRIVHVQDAVAVVRRVATFRDLWRQRVRAEAGKRQLRRLGLPLAAAPPGASVRGALRDYPVREWPLVAALAAVKIAARMRAAARPVSWRPAVSSKNVV
jgi:hypothetical protein